MGLSTAETEYNSLSQALREMISVINVLNEMKEHNISSVNTASSVYCKSFEDNTRALEMVKYPPMRPRTQNINIMYH